MTHALMALIAFLIFWLSLCVTSVTAELKKLREFFTEGDDAERF